MSRQRIAVIGGGPAGCAAAYGFLKSGHQVVIYEAAPALGGRTLTHRSDGFHLDTGAAFITNFYTRVLTLGQNAGFDQYRRELQRVTGLHHQGRLAHLNVGSVNSFLRFPFLGLGDKFKMTAWTVGLTLKRGRYDLADPATLMHRDHQTVGEMARAQLNETIYDFLIRPGIEPFWYFSCEDVSAALAEALTAHAAGASFYYFAGGIDQVSTHLAEGAKILVHTPVTHLEAVDGGVEVSAQTPAGPTVEGFDRVVLATTASTAYRLVREFPETLVSGAQREFLESQRYAANIHIAYRIPQLHSATPMGSIFPCGPGRHALAAFSFHRIKTDRAVQDGHELVSVYLSDPESRRLMAEDDSEVSARGWALARTVYPGLPEEASLFHMVRRTEAIPIHAVGRYGEAAQFLERQQAEERRVLFCGDYLSTATVEGAVASGLASSGLELLT